MANICVKEENTMQEKNKYDQDVREVRTKLANLRETLKNDFGASNDQFYQETASLMALEDGTHVSKTWVRDQCNVDHPSEPAYAKFQALKDFVNRYTKMIEGAGEADTNTDNPTMPVSRISQRTIEADYIEQAVLEEDVSKAVKFLMTDPSKALFKIAKMSRQLLKRHMDRGGNITPFVNYLRARAAFSFNTELSTSPIYALRNINTLEEAQAVNPGIKTTLAVYSVMLAINGTRTNFPWGDDDALRTSIQEMKDAMTPTPSKSKGPTLYQMNKALAQKVVGRKKKGL
jgi:hypothetical protein